MLIDEYKEVVQRRGLCAAKAETARLEEMHKVDMVFGVTVLRGIWASPGNPHRDGFFVRKFNRRSIMNGGWHVEVTDGKGEFWEYPLESVEVIEGF